MSELSEAMHRLSMQHAATRALVESSTLEQAAPKLLRSICQHLDWCIGVLWMIDPEQDALLPREVWSAPEVDARRFLSVTRETRFRRGEGLPGRVWQRNAAVWERDVQQDEHFPRLPAAAEAGLHGAVAFPIAIGGEVLGVMEFFSPEARVPAPDLREAMAAIGGQIGLFVQRRRVEEELRRSEERSRRLTETSPDAIVTIDSEDRILTANPAVERVFGYSPAELTGKPLTMLMPERMRERHVRGLDRYVRSGERQLDWAGVELPGLTKDGREIPLEVAFGEFDLDGKRVFTGFIRDITERVDQQRRLEQVAAELEDAIHELEERTEEAEAANRAKGDFLAVMSHELRTPLTAVLGFSELLDSEVSGPLSEKQRDHVERIQRSARQLLALLDQILTFARVEAAREAVEIERTDVNELVRSIVDLMEPLAADKALDLRAAASEGPLWVETDTDMLRQILLNLLGNAIKFTERGSIVIAARAVDEDVQLEVRDTGIGIEPDELERIFEPFRQIEPATTRRIGGAGLGLTVARHLATLLGAEIDAESEPGRGSTFRVRLPRRAPDDAEEAS